jgi:hypothetical protein
MWDILLLNAVARVLDTGFKELRRPSLYVLGYYLAGVSLVKSVYRDRNFGQCSETFCI